MAPTSPALFKVVAVGLLVVIAIGLTIFVGPLIRHASGSNGQRRGVIDLDMASPDSPELPPPPDWDNLDVVRDHPELHHYTTRDGLTGIVSTNTLWATHFRDLNDASELMMIREPLEQELTAEFRALFQEKRRRHLRADRAITALGGVQKVARDSAKQLIALLYASTYTNEPGYVGVKDLNAPAFITSFCHHTDNPYERENGLLSQWRGYGGAGGFCIVFDSERLLDLLAREHQANAYMRMALDPVTYLYPGTTVTSVFPKLRQVCVTAMAHLLDQKRADEPEDLFTDFTKAAAFCKHHAFHEECEVRIAVQAATEGWRRAMGKGGKWQVPPAKSSITDTAGRSRVVLFEGLGEALPIRRVIVGPSGDQHRNLRHARTLLDPTVPVVLSETPYVDRAGMARTC